MSYWQDTTKSKIQYSLQKPNGGILVVGAGFAGLSVALELRKHHDQVNVVFTDDNSYSKNAGHVIPTMGESLHVSIAIQGHKKAMDLQAHALRCSEAIAKWCSHKPDTLLDRGYYVIASNEIERNALAKSGGIYNTEWGHDEPHGMGNTPNFTSKQPSLYMPTGYFGNPVMFRDSLARECLKAGITITKCDGVEKITTHESGPAAAYKDGTVGMHDAIVLCNNAFPLDVQKSYTDQFVGQVAVSHPITSKRLTPMAFSADHGYIYGQITVDNRLLIGGWRNNVKDDGSLCNINNEITKGLQKFVDDNFQVDVDILNAEYEWRGAMAQTTDGLPVVGEIDTGVYACTGWNGYGFSQAHYTAQCLAKMIMDVPVDEESKRTIIEHFNPTRFR